MPLSRIPYLVLMGCSLHYLQFRHLLSHGANMNFRCSSRQVLIALPIDFAIAALLGVLVCYLQLVWNVVRMALLVSAIATLQIIHWPDLSTVLQSGKS